MPAINRYLRYALTVMVAALLILIEVNISSFAKGLLATPFLVLVAAAALFGDYITGVLAIVLSTASVLYVIPPAGFNLNSSVLFKTLEFLIASLLLTALAWKMRSFRKENSKLIMNAEQLTVIIKDLKKMSRGNSREIKRLNKVNENLTNLVDEFMEDDEFWSNRLRADMKRHQKSRR